MLNRVSSTELSGTPSDSQTAVAKGRIYGDLTRLTAAQGLFWDRDFERAFASSYGAANHSVLSEQYKMVEPICDLVTDIFYRLFSQAKPGVLVQNNLDRLAFG